MAIVGRAKIEQSQLDQLASIETNRKAALAKLSIQYAAADQVKTSFGYIGIISLSLLWGAFILNDLPSFLRLLYEIAKDLLKEGRELNRNREEKERDLKQVKIQMEDELYSQELEEKLDQIHFQLVKACVKRRAGQNYRSSRQMANNSKLRKKGDQI